MEDFLTIKFNFIGGVVSPGDLSKILNAAKLVNINSVKFSLRQQLILHVPNHLSKLLSSYLSIIDTKYYTDESSLPNIVSSYVSEAVFQKSTWVSEGIYKDIFDSFAFEPQLKINISDNNQSFSPFFSGHLNFVSSAIPNFWHFYLRLPKTNKVYSFENLIYTHDIHKACSLLESKILSDKHIQAQQLFSSLENLIIIPNSAPLVLPKFSLPYYEGFNRYDNKTWLGIYSRWETYDINFLIELCNLCKDSKIGEICLTPWKSLVVKGIKESERPEWSRILAKYNFNVRHAANELNWQVEDDSEEALKLKMELVEYLNHNDLRTFGLCFGIKIAPKTEVYASIMIQKRRIKFLNLIPLFNVYDISYTADFDPNGRTKVFYEKGLFKYNLKEQLRRSIFFYNKKITNQKLENKELVEIGEPIFANYHQCPDCLMVYDEKYGDELAGIPAGIIFDNLPINYECGVCGCVKEKFEIIRNYDI